MMRLRDLQLLVLVSLSVSCTHAAVHSEGELTQFLLGDYERDVSLECTEGTWASWNYETNLTDANADKVTEAALKMSKFSKDTYEQWFKDVKVDDIKNATVQRLLRQLKLIGSAALSPEQVKNLTETTSQMEHFYSTGKICPYKKQHCNLTAEGLNLSPDIEDIIEQSTDYDELTYVWKAWRDATGKKMRPLYRIYVELSNTFSKLNGFKDCGEYWRHSFETDNFEESLEAIWNKVRPLYKQLHSYARDKLVTRYGDKIDTTDGLLPANIFGNMWAQSWASLDPLLTPFPQETPVDLTKALRDQNYSVMKMFETANEFYMSLGLPTNEVSYGNKSMILRPEGREVTCHASAWDFCNKEDFLIKMCTKVNAEDFITIHHEMGHIQYYILYKNQLSEFREGANPGFHEAVGDTISLSVKSIKHLKSIGLVAQDYKESKESAINNLLSMALDKVAFMPFGYLIDKWRWDVFSGSVPESDWNKHWWEYREKYQLVKAPVNRSEADFDAGAKYHVPASSQYISYFVSHILQFQFYKQLCIAAGEYNPVTKSPPLHQCDFYRSKEAGQIMKDALSLGGSKPWPEVLKIIGGTDKLDASAMLEYFEPLSDHFTKIGYNAATRHLSPSPFLLLPIVFYFFF